MAFGIKIRSHGQKIDSSGVYASNHISWTDIPILSMVVGVPFVAKSEISAWPVIGTFAKYYGCVFVDRDRRSTVQSQANELNVQLNRSGNVILFPEGTTGLGDRVLPFKSALFHSAVGATATMIQPVAICYRDRDGAPLDSARLRQIAWIDDDKLLPHAVTLALSGPVYVDVYFEEPRIFACRKAAAAYCQDMVSIRVNSAVCLS